MLSGYDIARKWWNIDKMTTTLLSVNRFLGNFFFPGRQETSRVLIPTSASLTLQHHHTKTSIRGHHQDHPRNLCKATTSTCQQQQPDTHLPRSAITHQHNFQLLIGCFVFGIRHFSGAAPSSTRKLNWFASLSLIYGWWRACRKYLERVSHWRHSDFPINTTHRKLFSWSTTTKSMTF